MGRFPVRSLTVVLAAGLAFSGAALWAASSADGIATVSVRLRGGTTVEQQMVTGMVVLPIAASLGASAGAISLPPPSGLSGLSQLRIGTESLGRQLGRVVSRQGLQQASFTIFGERDQVVSIAVPETVSLTQLNGEGEVAFNPVTNLDGDGNGDSRLVASADGSGALEIDVGGRIAPTALAMAGDYSGVLNVTVQYN